MFVRRAFDVFDELEAGQIEFLPFVVGIWNYATMDHSALCVHHTHMLTLLLMADSHTRRASLRAGHCPWQDSLTVAVP
jgi:hypothetical protein